MTRLTDGEARMLRDLEARVERVRALLHGRRPADDSPEAWFTYLAALKELQGNANNDLSFLSCLMAKQYLVRRYGQCLLDVAGKPQGAPGLDIDVLVEGVGRVIGEVKTVEPYQVTDFGAQQKASFLRDFRKLEQASAAAKYLFVTSRRSHDVLKRRYQTFLPDVQLVLLDSRAVS